MKEEITEHMCAVQCLAFVCLINEIVDYFKVRLCNGKAVGDTEEKKHKQSTININKHQST